MEPNPELVIILQRLASGDIAPEDWLSWWQQNSSGVKESLNPGQIQRLKPRASVANAAALQSQAEACRLLTKWGIAHTRSARYELTWKKSFEEFCAEKDAEQSQRQKSYLPVLKNIEVSFPGFAKFLRKRIDIIERLGDPASQAELEQFENRHDIRLPPSYRQLLLCARTIHLGDVLKFGLDYTCIHERSQHVERPTHGRLWFGECWLEADGDQVLFGDVQSGQSEPPVLYYSHEGPRPVVRPMATHFTEWIEGISKWKAFRKPS